jgi:hypothetical protein
MAIDSLSALVSKSTGGNNGNPQHLDFFVDARMGPLGTAAPSQVAGQFTSMWRWNKTNGANGSSPDVNATPTRATIGALGQDNATGGRTLRMTGIEAFASQGTILYMYDRLFQSLQLRADVAGGQNINGPAVTRNVSGVGNEIWLELEGASSSTATVTYINQDGVQKTTPPITYGSAGFREDCRILKVPLAAGDRGVKSIVSAALNAVNSAVQTFSVLIVKPIAFALIDGAGGASVRDFLSGSTAIEQDACIAFAMMAATSTVVPRFQVIVNLIED